MTDNIETVKIDENQEVVEAGILRDLLKKFEKGFNKIFDSLAQVGVSIDKEKVHPVDPKDPQKGYIFVCSSGKGTLVKCKVVPTAGKNNKFWDVYIKSKEKSKKDQYHNVPTDKIDDCITKFYDKYFEEAFEDAEQGGEDFDINEFDEAPETNESEASEQETANSSKKLIIKLHTVTGGTKTKVVYEPVNCTYDPSEALSDVKTVCASEDFVSTLSCVPEMFEFVPCTDGVDVNRLEDDCVTCVNAADEIMKAYVQSLLDAMYLRGTETPANGLNPYMICGDIAGDIFWMIRSLEDIFRANGLQWSNFGNSQTESCVLEYEHRDSYIALIHRILDTVELYYNCFQHDIQSVLDNQIITFKTQWLARL